MSDREFTMKLRLCNDAGMVAGEYVGVLNRLRGLGSDVAYGGAPFACTGSAHLAGEHILCTSSAHEVMGQTVIGSPLNGWQVATADALPNRPERDENPLPEDLERLLRDPNIAIPQDELVHKVIVADLQRRPEATVPRNAYLNLWALYKRITA